MRKEVRKLYLRRATHFADQVKAHVYSGSSELDAQISLPGAIVPFDQRLSLHYETATKNKPYGRLWDYAWIHATGSIPPEWAGSRVAAHINIMNESCVYDQSGCPVYGLTTCSVFNEQYTKEYYPLSDKCNGAEPVDLWILAASAHWMSADPICIRELELRKVDTGCQALARDLEILISQLSALEEGSAHWSMILLAVNKAADVFGDDPARSAPARAALAPVLAFPAKASDPAACAVGHAHIDTAWLWPVRTTVGKVIRTFASQVANLQRYPSYTFGASSPAHYEMVREHSPALFDKISGFVRDGRWELQGGMWVEADCNLISGESMVRQILYGKNYFKDTFGIDVKTLWLPDVFGYSAALPQILEHSGIDYFITQKISWNEMNRFPLNTFTWRGIDGSTVFVHFPPENSYAGQLFPDSLVKGMKNFTENDVLDEFLCLYGMGDGGGGPREEMIERGLRMENIEGCPKVRFAKAEECMKRLAGKAGALETWTGELYLELHRGTYTTHAFIKRANRKTEFLLKNTEMLWSHIPLYRWPAKQLTALWKKVLLNQFHDIIPGSSVPEVYEDSKRDYTECASSCGDLIDQAAQQLFDKSETSLVAANFLPAEFTAPVRLPDSWDGLSVTTGDGATVPAQKCLDATYALIRIPSFDAVTLSKGRPLAAPPPRRASDETFILENKLVRYELNARGEVTCMFDKEASRSLVPQGQAGNVLSLYSDVPAVWEAWDIDIAYAGNKLELQKEVVYDGCSFGPVALQLRFRTTMGSSVISQIISLASNTKRLDFITRADWNEKRKMLRVSFPVAVCSDYASFDIQYGHVRRSVRKNSNEDIARFETVVHKYADLSDEQYGVALLNDCKYGCSVTDNVLDLNLIRSPQYPDAARGLGCTDQGEHTFTYSLLPHLGRLSDSPVIREAAMLNDPPLVIDGYKTRKIGLHPPCAITSDSIALEVMKKAEKENCLIVRLVEKQGKNATGVIQLAKGYTGLVETDLMEWENGQKLPGTTLNISMKPFEIRTYKLVPK